MNRSARPYVVAALFAAFTFTSQGSSQPDTFGSTSNTFTIDFVEIGNAGNAADSRYGMGSGAVPYNYRIGKYEISQDQIDKATASGLSDVIAGAWTGGKPAANISWYEAAAFVNWLNTSKGHQAAYNLAYTDGVWAVRLWTRADAWQLGGENLYRHKDAVYFLPNDNEWHKAAYYDPLESKYYLYPTASDTAPTPVTGGTAAGTAVYGLPYSTGPAEVVAAGGLSPYGTMGHGGNVYEWEETAFDGVNDSTSEDSVVRGGLWVLPASLISAPSRFALTGAESETTGFRVASIAADTHAAPTLEVSITSAGGTKTLIWDGFTAGPTDVEHSVDLSGWEKISISNATGTFQHATGTTTKGFYQLRWSPITPPTPRMITVQGGTLPEWDSGFGGGLTGIYVQTFQIGRYEVTWDEWREVRNWAVANGYSDLASVGFGTARHQPVRRVSWYDAVKWINAKSEKEGLVPVYQVSGSPYRTGESFPTVISSANGYRLPTEAEWQWAAIGGVKSRNYAFSGSSDPNAVAWYEDNIADAVNWGVGQKAANELGIHDMSGNVWEWVQDGIDGDVLRRMRGGGVNSPAGPCYTTSRGNLVPIGSIDADFGFRVARNAP